MITVPLICLADVVQLLPTWRQALLRSMGSRGADAFTEVVGRRLAPFYVQEEHQGMLGEGGQLGHSPAIVDSTTTTPTLTICVDALVATNIMDAVSDVVPLSLDWLGGINTVDILLTGGEAVRTIGSLLISNHTVQSIWFDSSFFRVTTITSDCITQCHNLMCIGMDQLVGLHRIGDRFADRCISLTSLDMTPLIQLQQIGCHFIRKCTKLQTLQLPTGVDGRGCLSSIGDGFAFHCASLHELPLNPLRSVTSLPNHFLVGCSSLTALDFTPMAPVLRHIGSGFLMECRGLRTLDISPLSHVTAIPDRFLSSCSLLTNIDFTPLCGITEIGAGFMAECVRLRELDLSSLVGLCNIGGRFLAGCTDLEDITFPKKSSARENREGIDSGVCWTFSKMTAIPDGYLHGCNRLTNVDLSPFAGVTSVGSDFLSQCSRIEHVDLSPLHAVTSIGARCMYKCISLNHIDVSPLTSVQWVDEYFLAYCTSLSPLPPDVFAPMATTATFNPHGFLEASRDRNEVMDNMQLGKETPDTSHWPRRY